MSKKKRLRKLEKNEIEDAFLGIMETVFEEREFILESTPIEISMNLTTLGVSTTHKDGINKFLREWRPEAGQDEPLSAFEALAEHWEAEIKKKRGTEPDFEDTIFLMEAARHYWGKLNPGALQEPV